MPMPTCGMTHKTDVSRSPIRKRYRASARQDLVEQRLGLVLVRLLSERELADENLPGLREHALLTGRQPALAVAPPQVANDLGDLVHVTGRELLQIGLVPARPVGRLFGVRRTQHLEDALEAFLSDYISYTDKFRVICWNPHRQVTLVDLENEVALILALDRTDLDFFDPSSPMVGVDDGVADLESHVARTPSAAPILPRRPTNNSRACRQRCRSRALLHTVNE